MPYTTILIVDDSATTRAMIRRIIGMCQLPVEEILEARDGAEALELMARLPVCLVLADLHMPVMGGAEMTQRMMGDPGLSRIPVVIISAEPNVDRIDRLLESGVRGYLPKPFTPESFRNLLSCVLPDAA